jgi:hypothetical protein
MLGFGLIALLVCIISLPATPIYFWVVALGFILFGLGREVWK